MKKLLLGLIVSAFYSVVVLADEASIAENLSKVIPNISKEDVSKTPITGLYQVIVGARIIYVSDDGRYIIQGDMVDLSNRENMTESMLNSVRKGVLDKVDEKNMIIFVAKKPRHTVTIFSDIDCGYCRKLHAGIDNYLDAGITVRYLFFPRSGPNTESYFKAVSVWCADDRNEALTDAKLNNKVVTKTCDNPIDEHMKLAQAFGINGTPAIIADDGTMVPGFVPAKELVKHLGW
ncbi:MAG: disulfide bond formation protein DsbC [Cycloclasticus sp.]|nr:MAG: disulfide bond formation protein DsbC [Cycloclasticus sp.]